MNLKQLLRSSPVRLAVVYVVLFGSSALLLMAFIYWSTAGFMLRQADETIEAEIAGLAERYQIAGISGLTSLIEERLERQPSGFSLYLVADASYRPLVGNLSGWPRVELDVETSGTPPRAGTVRLSVGCTSEAPRCGHVQ